MNIKSLRQTPSNSCISIKPVIKKLPSFTKDAEYVEFFILNYSYERRLFVQRLN